MHRLASTTIVLDLSSSMAGRPWAMAVEIAAALVADVPEDEVVNVIGFEDTARELGCVAGGDELTLDSLLAHAAVGGRSNLSAGLVRALSDSACPSPIESPAGRRVESQRDRRIVVLSDGAANLGIMDPLLLGRLVDHTMSTGSTVSTMCVGEDADGLLAAVAACGSGTAEVVLLGQRVAARDARSDDRAELTFSTERARRRRLATLVEGQSPGRGGQK